MRKCPYTFPHRSREAITDYLAEHENYGGSNHPWGGWSPLSWNVKLHRVDTSGKVANGEYETTDALDEEWAAHVRENEDDLWSWTIEDMRDFYRTGLYTTSPGDDQGDWHFQFGGRSGGHMILAKWEHEDFMRMFKYREDFREWLDGQPFATIRRLYRGIRNLDVDITRENLESEFAYQLNYRRGQWEEERLKEREEWSELVRAVDQLECA